MLGLCDVNITWEEHQMRMLLKAQVSTETAIAVLKDGSLGDTLNSILADTKPEAVYFLIEDGLRTVLVFLTCKM